MDKYGELMVESKRTINKWEQDFQKTCGRKPQKDDFKDAPSSVIEAYKLYYKIKKRQETLGEGNISSSPKPSNEDSRILVEQLDNAPAAVTKVEVPPSAWGEHLNKPKISDIVEAPLKSSPAGSNNNKYSKLTEKLMKGAKINIRSSLTRKPSKIFTNEGSPNVSAAESASASPSLELNHLSKPVEAGQFVDPEPEVLKAFKPKIIQQKYTKKNSTFTLRGIQADEQDSVVRLTSSRVVDLQWLDDCLADGKVPEPLAQQSNDDEDILDPSDDERAPPNQDSNIKTSHLSSSSPPSVAHGVKRKFDINKEDEAVPITSKRSRMQNNDSFHTKNEPSTDRHQDHKLTSQPALDEVSDVPLENSATAIKKERLAQKMASGTANQNFVRINLKKKVFVRGKKTQTGSSYKRQQWKERQGIGRRGRGGGKGNYKNTTACRRCGEIGHWAKNCMGEKLLSLENMKEQDEAEELEFPTLEEAMEKAAVDEEPAKKKGKASKASTFSTNEKEEDLQLVEIPVVPVIEPLCSLTDPMPKMAFDALKKFGYTEFRDGQEEAVKRIMSGASTLVVQSTGAGKSLCYQLPAYLYAQRSAAITIVVSPLVSLMEDQVANLPSFVKGACLHSGQSEGNRQKTLQALQAGLVHILLLSAEAVVSSGPFGLATLLRTHLPPVAFVCIDEAHCVSQWSHNFRPSYLRICKILREKMNIRTILGLTATAPKSTVCSIAQHLGVDASAGIIRGTLLPLNLQLSVSRDADRDAALLQLLQSGRFAEYDSIIIYCIRREECERLATLLRTCLKDPIRDMASKGGHSRRKGISWSAESYHAGLTAARRIAVQKQFMSGKLRVVIATVAFGMGINKADIRAIIHYNAPKNFENYVQEIGRAGRDGKPASCHVFLNCEGRDLQELRRFIYANSTDRHVVRKLMRKILPEPCSCPKLEDGSSGCPGHEVAMVVDSTVQELDMPEENIATLLCQLESHSVGLVREIGTKVYAACTVRSYGGLQQLKQAARECPPLGAALALQDGKQGSETGSAIRTFQVVEVASRINWDSGRVKRTLKELEWDKSAVAIGGKVRRSGLMVEFSDLAFHLKVRGDLSETEQDDALEFLHQRCLQRESNDIQQLQRIHQALLSVSYANASSCCDEVDQTKSDKLRGFIHDYFEEMMPLPDASSSTGALHPAAENGQIPDGQESSIRSDIRSLILNYRDQTFTARSIARILHGIASPCFPAEIWGKARKHWRAQLHQDFNLLIRLATQELIALK